MLRALQTILTVLTGLMLVQDLVPLGRWNALRTLAAQSPLRHRIRMTIINTASVAAALLCTRSSHYLHPFSWQHSAATIILGFFLLGAYISWWKPWIFGSTDVQRQKLQRITDGTFAFIPARHGVTPNALHCLFHLLAVVALILCVLL